MARFYLLLSLLLIFFIDACSTVSVNSDYDPTVDFSAIQTYSWGRANGGEDELAKNPLLKKRIMLSVDRYLQARGYHKVDPGRADILVVVQAVVKEKMQVTDWGGPRGYYRDPWYDPWWGSSVYGGRVDVNYYQEGTLIIDVVDNAKKELIWRGLGTGIVNQYKNQEKQQAAADEYVQKILNYFPPGNEKKTK